MRSVGTDEKRPLGPLVTLVTSTLNADRTLEALVQSLREQSDAEFDWIIADDLTP